MNELRFHVPRTTFHVGKELHSADGSSVSALKKELPEHRGALFQVKKKTELDGRHTGDGRSNRAI
jgi:hypothetical protein